MPRKVESLRELNALCQKPHYRTVGNWMVRRIERPLALYLTWALLHTPVTANQVTAVSFLVALGAGFFLAQPWTGALLTGMGLLQFWYLLDHVDGQIARYRKTDSADGLFFDFMMHHLVNFIPLFCISLSLYSDSFDMGWVITGYVASVSLGLVAILNDAKAKAFYAYLLKGEGNFFVRREGASPTIQKSSSGPTKKIFSLFHKFCEGHVVMNVWTGVAIYGFFAGGYFLGSVDVRAVLVAATAVIATLVWTVKMAVWVRARRVSHDFDGIFREGKS